MDSLNTRVSLYDIYPDFDSMKNVPVFEPATTPVKSAGNESFNWGLVLMIALATGVGVYCAVKWWEEKRNN